MIVESYTTQYPTSLVISPYKKNFKDAPFSAYLRQLISGVLTMA